MKEPIPIGSLVAIRPTMLFLDGEPTTAPEEIREAQCHRGNATIR